MNTTSRKIVQSQDVFAVMQHKYQACSSRMAEFDINTCRESNLLIMRYPIFDEQRVVKVEGGLGEISFRGQAGEMPI